MITKRVLYQKIDHWVFKNITRKFKLYKVKDLYYTLKRMPRKIKQVVRWIPTIYSFDWYDYAFILEIWEKALREQSVNYKNRNKYRFSDPKRSADIAKTLDDMADTLNRLQNNSYTDKEHDALPTFKIIRRAVKDKDGYILHYRVVDRFKSNKDKELHSKLMRKIMSLDLRRRNKDLKRFGELFKDNILRLWD